MSRGIKDALEAFAKDEGELAAIRKVERWRDVLEEIIEVAKPYERQWIARLLTQLGRRSPNDSGDNKRNNQGTGDSES